MVGTRKPRLRPRRPRLFQRHHSRHNSRQWLATFAEIEARGIPMTDVIIIALLNYLKPHYPRISYATFDKVCSELYLPSAFEHSYHNITVWPNRNLIRVLADVHRKYPTESYKYFNYDIDDPNCFPDILRDIQNNSWK